MKITTNILGLLAAVAALAVLDAPARAQTPEKFQFRLNWTLYGEHAPFFVARDKGFYRTKASTWRSWKGAAPRQSPSSSPT